MSKILKILIIAGHGGSPYDSGAVGYGYREADLTRELAKLVVSNLKKYATVDLYDTSKDAYRECLKGTFNVGSYDYVLELHFNAFNGNAYGSECYVTTREEGISVEQEIMKRMDKYFTLRDNDSIFDGVKRENFLVINTLKNRGISGSLLEVCFIDNYNDMLTYQKNKGNIALDIAEGIAEGFGLKQISTTPPDNNVLVGKVIKEFGVFTVTIDAIKIRNAPSLNAQYTGVNYNRGERVIYDQYIIQGGYKWISWVDFSNTRRWMASGEVDANGNMVDSYGSFKW